MTNVHWPTAVIAGAPKCGTTSLFTWLTEHPDVCPSRPKETGYLFDVGYPLQHTEHTYHLGGLAGYARFFEHCSDEAPVRIEATPDYLYQRTPLQVLGQLQPPPALIFLLRRPSARLYSLFQFARNNRARLPRSLSFADYVEQLMQEADTLRGREIVRLGLAHGRYADYLKVWYRSFDPAKIFVYLFEDMQRDPFKLVTRVAADLGLDPAFYDGREFMRQNETYRIRFTLLQRAGLSIVPLVPEGALRRLAKGVYRGLATGRLPPRSRDDESALRTLDEYYRVPNRELADLTGLDLSAWD